ncbi:hypothetical protein EV363DRAFT_1322922, partial [Boletus edulis]
EKIEDYKITEVLNTKLGKGKPKEIRTSLICLDIFRSFESRGGDPFRLSSDGYGMIGHPKKHGVAAILPRVQEIVEMLLPDGYLPIQPTTAQTTSVGSTSPDEDQAQPDAPTTESSESQSDAPSRPPSWMLGPACALRMLGAERDSLRTHTRETLQYGSLKHLYLSGTLVGRGRYTPNRADIIDMLDKMIKAVSCRSGTLSLPHIEHWDRLVTMLRDRSAAVVTVLPALLGVSVLAVLAVVVFTPIYASVWVYGFFKRRLSGYLENRALINLRQGETGTVQAPHQAGSAAPDRHDGEGPSGTHGDESSQDVETTSTQGVRDGKQLERSGSTQIEAVEATTYSG